MKNRISDLRNHLFETLEKLKDEDQPLDLQRAKAIVEVAQTIIESAKVEVQFLKAIDATGGSEFFPAPGTESRGPTLAPESLPRPQSHRGMGVGISDRHGTSLDRAK